MIHNVIETRSLAGFLETITGLTPLFFCENYGSPLSYLPPSQHVVDHAIKFFRFHVIGAIHRGSTPRNTEIS